MPEIMRATIDDKGMLSVTQATEHSSGKDLHVAVTLDLFHIFEAMDDAAKRKVAEALTWDYILDQAMARLTGESECYSQPSDRMRAFGLMPKLLAMATDRERNFIESLGKLREFAATLADSEALYWKLYHSEALARDAGGKALLPYDAVPGDVHERHVTMSQVFRKWADANKWHSPHYAENETPFADFAARVYSTMREKLAMPDDVADCLSRVADYKHEPTDDQRVLDCLFVAKFFAKHYEATEQGKESLPCSVATTPVMPDNLRESMAYILVEGEHAELSGSNVRDLYREAVEVIRFFAKSPTPQSVILPQPVCTGYWWRKGSGDNQPWAVVKVSKHPHINLGQLFWCYPETENVVHDISMAGVQWVAIVEPTTEAKAKGE